MKPFDGQDDLNTKNVPELIKHLWEVYMQMSLDPALRASADHIKQAALTLEHTRRLALEISQETPRAGASGKRRARQLTREDAGLDWLRVAKAGSPSKH
ncbi:MULTISPECIES: hypothetical protein [Rhodomicrobium]|uniref:hypothetical protein n=1 Tax=Rhodomicrobium TaxID=1068 RepID=UPI000B4BE639|nr:MULTISPECIES: hypothetical protein [Rhodomicrobium]